ncbi:hypothetical protein [uncultured Zoogloea sp.]|uniref:hypothetical protein n=1 Tax=uncultured Zoogloea sp. TaxID=160237 RepID=UPI00263461BD|nr:hypothetical protein [uncultured Zoogloea sp.]
MTIIDLNGLALAIVIGGTLAAIGTGIDSLLLARHVEAIDKLALRWWVFFDDLKIIDIPRIAVGVYIKGKNVVLGSGFSPTFFLRSFLLSLVLTIITVPGGRALGLALLQACNHQTGWMTEQSFSFFETLKIGWGWAGMQTIAYLVPVNIAFDFATIFVTILILSKALTKTNYFLLALICLDIVACVVLFYNAVYIADQFDSASIVSANGYWQLYPSFLNAFTYGCAAFHILTSKLLFVSTILLPTLIYLILIVALFLLREGFRLFKFITMHVLEKSVEDKKTIFAHLGTTLGLITAVGKAVVEMAKLI